MKVLIIEDEARTAKDLKKMLEKTDNDIQVLTILPSVESAIKWFLENESPDLIFSDIQLGDGLSFDIFRQVKIKSPVIFCTAYDEYAINAFEANSIDYLLKPLDEEMLEKSIEKYNRFRQHFVSQPLEYNQNLNRVLTEMDQKHKRSLLVYSGEKIIPIKVSDVCFICSTNGIITLYTVKNIEYSIQYSMEQLESMLDFRQFFRANRQFLINRDAIQIVEHYFNRRLFLKLNCETSDKIIISKTKAQEFLNWIES